MKSLKESLFDPNLVLQKLPYEKLLKSNITIEDIAELILGVSVGNCDDIKNRHLKRWAEDFYDKYYKNNSKTSWFGTSGSYYPKEESCQEAINWLKFNKIHTDICWNDRMYASSLDIDLFDKNINDVFEWIMFSSHNNKSTSPWCISYILVNRKEYDEMDQAVIHKLIETIAKK